MRAKDRNETRRIAKRHRSAPKIVNAASLPDKGEDDAYGNPFLGLPREKIANNAISNDELGPNSVLNGNIGEQINATHLPNLVGLNGDLPIDRTTGSLAASRLSGNIPDANIPNIGKGKLPGDVVYGNAAGKVERAKIVDDLNGDKLIKDGTLPVSALAARPWSNKTDSGQVRRIARRIARDEIRNMVKATSLKGG